MRKQEYRTLMLEPQWHPIRWARKHISGDDVFAFLIFWDIIVPIVVALPHPGHIGAWPWWRITLFALGVAPLAALVLAIVIVLLFAIGDGIFWFHRHPPFKVKTRYRIKD